MCTKGLPDDVIPGASSLMSIDIWLTEIAQECKQATNMDTFMLPPLVSNNDIYLFTILSACGV